MNLIADPPLASLGDALTEQPLDIPRIAPLQDPIPSRTSERPLLLEPDTGSQRADHASKVRLSGQKVKSRIEADSTTKRLQSDNLVSQTIEPKMVEVPKLIVLPSTISPRMLDRRLDGFKTIVDSSAQSQGMDEFVQLPKPPDKPTAMKLLPHPALPPMLNGLHEPPPYVARFPPINPNDVPGLRRKSIEEPVCVGSPMEPHTLQDRMGSCPHSQSKSKKPKMLQSRSRRKWSEQETNDLLRGVARFGIGNWKKILSYSEYHFQSRSSIDLKDRFRVCCPDAYCSHLKVQVPDTSSKGRIPSGMTIENLLQPSSMSSPLLSSQPNPNVKSKNTRSHRKNPCELARLGITGPFPKANRRSRHAFTEEEDINLWHGYETYGFQWAVIQKDPSFCLGHRKSTDLRDRFRNKFSEIYKQGGLRPSGEGPKLSMSSSAAELFLRPPVLVGESKAELAFRKDHSGRPGKLSPKLPEEISEEGEDVTTYQPLMDWEGEFLDT
ncbi:MAG: hypothetical protein M1834_003422 [Cirrosporium novae-zelandiae]|nr:MAG: hypothetical protein M1834_003422 [Cirrosporium novae-zelandiae]